MSDAAGAGGEGGAPGIAQVLAAAEAGDAAKMRVLIDQGANPADSDQEGITPLMRAAEGGHTEAVSLLLEAGVPWHAQDAEGYTAGEYASGSRQTAMVEQLLDWAVRSELLLGAAGRSARAAAGSGQQRKDPLRVLGDPPKGPQRRQQQRPEGGESSGGGSGGGGASGRAPVAAGAAAQGDGEEEVGGALQQEEEGSGGHGGGGAKGYLQQRLVFSDGKIVDEQGEAVMMGWEAPLMERHADLICSSSRGDVLNVGFGLGIVDEAIQSHHPRSHTIVEAHPDVYRKMLEDGWGDRPGVRVVFGRWQDVVGDLGPFDGIFWDTYSEYWEDMREFQEHLPRLLRPGGIYSFFNGFASDNIFFHLVTGRLIQLELQRLGLSTTYVPVPIDATQDAIWEGVTNKYWHFSVYFLPDCRWAEEEGKGAAQGEDDSAAGVSASANKQTNLIAPAVLP